MVRAIKVTEENLTFIVQYAAAVNMDLSYLRDNVESNADFGWETYVVTDGTIKDNNVVFTTWSEPGFRETWEFIEPETTIYWQDVIRV